MIAFDLVAIFASLQVRETRVDNAHLLAQYCGADHVLVFGKDEEVGLYLPAPSLAQTLRQGGRWQAFLAGCQPENRGALPDPSGCGDLPAYGAVDARGYVALVFLGEEPHAAILAEIAALMPLLGASFVLERRMLAADGHAQAAREASRRAGTLNEALDVNRRELQAAYHKVEYELNSRRAAEKKLLDADRRKDEFLAMLAHELRNPLAPIAMAAQLLKLGTASPTRLRQASEVIARQVAHMTHLLDDLLDVSRVTGGRVALANKLLDMRAIVSEALEQARPLVATRAHKLSVALPPQPLWVRGDATRLVQIVANLLTNAAKYTPPSGAIMVQLEDATDNVALTISDTGIGIEPTLLPHVFELFTQGERSSDRALGGLGLGLALVKNLTERHGGSVQARSEGSGKGSQFELMLPSASPFAIDEAVHTTHCQPSALVHRILIVDDNEDAALTLALYLEAKGHEVKTAFDAATAMSIASAFVPRVFVLDIGLPDMDGCELAARLRERVDTRDSILVALTGYGNDEDRLRTREAGFDHHLVKPVVPGELTALLGTMTERDAAQV